MIVYGKHTRGDASAVRVRETACRVRAICGRMAVGYWASHLPKQQHLHVHTSALCAGRQSLRASALLGGAELGLHRCGHIGDAALHERQHGADRLHGAALLPMAGRQASWLGGCQAGRQADGLVGRHAGWLAG